MNKFSLMIMLGVLLGASACSSISEIEDQKESVVFEEVIITASQEYDSQTKTVLKNNGSVWWKPNDAIGVFFGSFFSKFYSSNTVEAPVSQFVGNLMFIEGSTENAGGSPAPVDYWGVFPPELTNKYTQDQSFRYANGNSDYQAPTREGESVNVYLPARQRGVPGTFDSNYFISIAKSDDYKELAFYNLCGGLAFCVKADNINEVTFRGNDGETLAGQVNVVMNSEGRPVVNEVRNGKTEITFALNRGEYFIPGEWYYIVMLPTTLEKGYTMTFNTGAFKGEYVCTDPVEIKRSVFGRLKEPDTKVSEFIRSGLAIEIDGSFADWDDLGADHVSTAICSPDALHTALKTMKVCADSEYIYCYFEYDDEQLYDKTYVPIEFLINTDASYSSGDDYDIGYIGQAGTDILLEGSIIEEDELCSFDPYCFIYTGSEDEWSWEFDGLCDGYGLGPGAGEGNKYEFAIYRELFGSYDISDRFLVGLWLLQDWNPVGILPNADVTEYNSKGKAPMLEVNVFKKSATL